MKFFTVVLDAFDGRQYGMLTIAVEASTLERATAEATKRAEADGYTRIKIIMVL